MSCPNINSPEWKALTKQVSQEKAYELWRTFDGNVPQDAIDQALGKLSTSIRVPTLLEYVLFFNINQDLLIFSAALK